MQLMRVTARFHATPGRYLTSHLPILSAARQTRNFTYHTDRWSISGSPRYLCRPQPRKFNAEDYPLIERVLHLAPTHDDQVYGYAAQELELLIAGLLIGVKSSRR